MTFLVLAAARRGNFQPPPTRGRIVVSRQSFSLSVNAGDTTPRTFDFTIDSDAALPAVVGLTLGTPTDAYAAIAFVSGTTYRVTLTPTGSAHTIDTGTITLTATNADPVVLDYDLTEVALPVPILTLTPIGGQAFTMQEGDSVVSPAALTFSIANTGTGGQITGLAAQLTYSSGATGYADVSLNQTTTPATGTITPDPNDVDNVNDGAYVISVTVTGAGGLSASLDYDFTVDPVSGGAFYAAPRNPPPGMGWDTANAAPTGSVWEPAEEWNHDDVPVWIDLTLVPDEFGRVIVDGVTTSTVAAAIAQAWANADAAGRVWTGGPVGDVAGVPRNRGYLIPAGMTLRAFTWPHNTAATGKRGIKPIGHTPSATLKTPPAPSANTHITFETVQNDIPAIQTSTSGQADRTHGGWGMWRFHARAAGSTGGSFSAFTNGIVRLGSAGTDQNTLAKVPSGIILQDFTILGQRRRYFRRGLENHATNTRCRAYLIDEIHNSYNYGADDGLTQDAQCQIGWNTPGRQDYRYGIHHGADEGGMQGGAGSRIPNLPNLTGIFYGWCEASANTDYLFGTENTVVKNGPFDKTTPNGTGNYAFWQHKNGWEWKIGTGIWYHACRGTGQRAPNNNQGYMWAGKSNYYGTTNPLQRAESITLTFCWADDCPAFIGLLVGAPGNAGANPPETGLTLRDVEILDCYAWRVGVSPYNQTSKRRALAVADGIVGSGQPLGNYQQLLGLRFTHTAVATDLASSDGSFFGPPGCIPGFVLEDSFLPYCGNGVWCSNGGAGGASLQAKGKLGMDMLAGSAGNYSANRNTLIPKSGLPSTGSERYDTGVGLTGWTAEADLTTVFEDYPNGDLRLKAGSPYLAGGLYASTDGHNRGPRNPDLVYAALAECPTILASHPTIP